MNAEEALVIVIDDDASVRSSTARLIHALGLKAKTFESAKAFLASPRPGGPACLVLDIHMPDMNGLDLQRVLATSARRLPIIFITGQGDIPMSVKAMKAGAFEFLTKPFREIDLINAIPQALQADRVACTEDFKTAEIRARYQSLTRREREVFVRVVAGMLNKQIAAELGTTEKTIKFHRAHMIKKMNAASVPNLVAFANTLGVHL